jgi:hypothetical protein
VTKGVPATLKKFQIDGTKQGSRARDSLPSNLITLPETNGEISFETA